MISAARVPSFTILLAAAPAHNSPPNDRMTLRQIQSGEPIPDARLEARPTAELTVEEQQRTVLRLEEDRVPARLPFAVGLHAVRRACSDARAMRLFS